MKSLYIVRHARAHRKGLNSTDFARRLSGEGMSDARQIGELLRSKNAIPDLIISSAANRAIETAEIIAEKIGYPDTQIEISEELYEIEIDDLLDILHHLDDQYDSVMLVGHNPPMSVLSDYLTRYGVGNLTPGSVFCCEFAVDTWKGITKYSGVCKFLESPH